MNRLNMKEREREREREKERGERENFHLVERINEEIK